MRLQLEAMLRAGQNEAILAQAEDSLAHGSIDQGAAGWVAIMACRAAGQLENWGKAVEWAERAVRHVGKRDPEALGWGYFLLGTALMRISEYPRSEQLLRSFLELAVRTPSLRPLTADALFNMALLMRCLKREVQEVAFFQEAVDSYAAQGRHGQIITCHLEIAWTELLAGHTADALAEIEAAEALLPDHASPDESTHAQILRAAWHSESGLVSESVALCTQLADLDDLPCRQSADIAWITARNALKIGDLVQAAMWANEAESLAAEDWWPPQMDRIKELKKTVAEHWHGRANLPN